MRFSKLIFLFVLLSCSLSLGAEKPQFPVLKDAELVQYFLAKAIRLSGLDPLTTKQLPPIYLVSVDELNREVCPEDPSNCRNLAAVFDDLEYRILVRNDFDLSDNFKPYDYSFVIHEIIHALQYRQKGPEIFRNCQAVYNTELQAYTAQDNYLKEEGDFHRPGTFLRFFYCDEQQAGRDYQKSLTVWEERLTNGFWEKFAP